MIKVIKFLEKQRSPVERKGLSPMRITLTLKKTLLLKLVTDRVNFLLDNKRYMINLLENTIYHQIATWAKGLRSVPITHEPPSWVEGNTE